MTDEEIAKELADYMRSIGWSRTKAETQSRMWFDFVASRIRKQDDDAGKCTHCSADVGDCTCGKYEGVR